jgi:hypothetical protein
MPFRSSDARAGSFLLIAALALAGCDSSTDSVPVQVPSVTFEAVGDARQLEANIPGSTVLPEWESLNPEIVTVTRAGMAVSVAPGTARVVARVRSGEGEGTVTVLPHVSVELTAVSKQSGAEGFEDIRLDLSNTGGRGFYRFRIMRDPAQPGGQHTVITDFWNDTSIIPGASYFVQMPVPAPADWVAVYSRSPHSEEYRRTGCMRFDGGDCPLPPVS